MYQTTLSTTALLWLHADPVSRHTAYSGRVAETGGLGQFDPLGNEVSTVPDPAEYEEPPYTDPDLPFFWPIENHSQAWAWEGDVAMEDHVLRVNADYDRGRAEYFWGHGRRDIAQEIISRNPNVGVEIRGFGSGWEYSGSVFGSQAAGFLTRLDQAIQTGALVAAGSQTGGMNDCEKYLAGMLGVKALISLTGTGLILPLEPSVEATLVAIYTAVSQTPQSYRTCMSRLAENF